MKQQKKQLMLLVTLAASLIGSAVVGKRVINADVGTIRAGEIS